MTCFQNNSHDQVGIWMLHAATMTASDFHRSEVASWQIHAAALTALHWGFPIGVKKGFRKQRYGYGSNAAFRASTNLPWSFHKRRLPKDGFSDNLHEWSQEDMLWKAF